MSKYKFQTDENHLSICFSSEIGFVDKAVKDIVEYCNPRYTNFNEFGVKLVLFEALTNAVKHGNRSESTKKVELEAELLSDAISIKIIDEGCGFNHDNVGWAMNDKMEPGKRGVPIIRSYCREVTYLGKGNKLHMTIDATKTTD